MQVAVLGLWHLGCVTAACVAAAGHATVGIDLDGETVGRLRQGMAPLFEPGLDALIGSQLGAGRLSFTSDLAAVAGCDLVWVTLDTPVDDKDRADVGTVEMLVARSFPHLRDGAVVLVSSQLPVGSTRRLALAFASARPGAKATFACSPENLRLGDAIRVFREAERIVVGVDDDEQARARLRTLLETFTSRIVFMRLESAEMVKHGVNAFLATCVTFANELARVCEQVGADAAEVEGALRLEPRIGARAYIRPGAPFAGGTLARDVVFLNETAAIHRLDLPLLGSVLASNEAHKTWPVRRLLAAWENLERRSVAVLGLTYKPGTDTLRRSWSIEVCRELVRHGARVRAFDPHVRALPADLQASIELAESTETALRGSQAVIVATEWPEFRQLGQDLWVDAFPSGLVLDPNRFLADQVAGLPGISYQSVGRA